MINLPDTLYYNNKKKATSLKLVKMVKKGLKKRDRKFRDQNTL